MFPEESYEAKEHEVAVATEAIVAVLDPIIEDRLRALGVDPSTIDPMVGGYSPMFELLRGSPPR